MSGRSSCCHGLFLSLRLSLHSAPSSSSSGLVSELGAAIRWRCCENCPRGCGPAPGYRGRSGPGPHLSPAASQRAVLRGAEACAGSRLLGLVSSRSARRGGAGGAAAAAGGGGAAAGARPRSSRRGRRAWPRSCTSTPESRLRPCLRPPRPGPAGLSVRGALGSWSAHEGHEPGARR